MAAWWLSRAGPTLIAPLGRTPTGRHCHRWQHHPQPRNSHATRTALCDGRPSAPRRESLACGEPREHPRRKCGRRRAEPNHRVGAKSPHVASSNPTRPRPAALPREPRTPDPVRAPVAAFPSCSWSRLRPAHPLSRRHPSHSCRREPGRETTLPVDLGLGGIVHMVAVLGAFLASLGTRLLIHIGSCTHGRRWAP